MNLTAILNQIPDYAKDIRLNLTSVLSPEGAPDLSQTQIYGIALASALASKNPAIISAIEEQASNSLSETEVAAAKAAAVIMGMNNIYYRFVHLASDKDFATLPARLRMNVIGKPGIAKLDFELYCLAVSAINGCGMCIDAHTQELIQHGVSKLAIQSAIRIAAVINGLSVIRFD